MKIVKIVVASIAVLFIGYHSIEIKKLDEVKKASTETFDALAFAHNFLEKTLPPSFSKAPSVATLLALLSKEPKKAFQEMSNAVAIGNIRYFLVKGEGQITKIQDDEIQVLLPNQTQPISVKLATEFIYGNAIRDAAGVFDIKQFTNTSDINNISAEINKIIRTERVPAFKKQIKVGDSIQFVGALEMNQEYLKLQNLEILPIEFNKI
ncbi:DUF2291 domain-containing protein [Arcicella sp. DC2W]|uniref:DUF2291 domain-containing protein n=1 Tax=Arcicella gelida TaxID=2984195 RepID=A0ABU5S9E4_9BACT|nr:DUF2291 domain-containing protein [Arcicella sp. DC2W]MEA5405100.1 DUF2291 domain-containing protein [Arcicella sp. DC2W]